MNAKQRRWYFANATRKPAEIPRSFFEDREHTIKPTTGIKMPSRFIKKQKEEKVTDTIKVNFGVVNYGHSVERTFETKN